MASIDFILGNIRRKLKGSPKGKAQYKFVENYDQFLAGKKDLGRALVSYLPGELIKAADTNTMIRFNPTGAILNIAAALNELGYTVDMVDFRDQTFEPTRRYDLFVGHGAYNFESITTRLQGSPKIVNYSTGCYWKAFIQQSQERYNRFREATGNHVKDGRHVRAIHNEEFASIQADLVICLGKQTAKSYEQVARSVIAINNAGYADQSFDPTAQDFEAGRRNFIYFAGTGNVQKGLDLLIEAFAKMPDLNLFIYSPIEPEVRRGYKRELLRSNIHYVHHYRFFPKLYSRLFRSAIFTLYAGFNSGQSTALIGSLALGMIPVVNRESDIDIGDFGQLIEASAVNDIITAITEISQRSENWYRKAASQAVKYHAEIHSPSAFRRGFREAVASIL